MATNLDALKQKLIDLKLIVDYNQDIQCLDTFSQHIWHFYLKNSQNYRLFNRKIQLRNKLSQTLCKYFNENGLKFIDIFISGSTVSGFATNDSDIDLCFIVEDFYNYEFIKSKKLKILRQIEETLVLNGIQLVDSQVIEARVPILRYIDGQNHIQVEINVNNQIGIRNTRLLYCYSKLDWRVVPICIAIKRWAKYYEIIDSFNGSLSSYTVELMSIFYLQNRYPPVLPCLQNTDRELFDPNVDIESFKCLPDLKDLVPFKSTNTETLSRLFVGFFKFYLFEFQFSKEVISVRKGKPLDRKSYIPFLSDPGQWEYICVEEPFSQCNAGRTVYELSAYNMICNSFMKMYEKSNELIDCICDCV